MSRQFPQTGPRPVFVIMVLLCAASAVYFTRARAGGTCTDDTWNGAATINAPAARYAHTAVWTGSQMIVWGGSASGFLNTGGRYNPSTDTWTATSTTNAPAARRFHITIWTGTEMIVWGGRDSNNNFLNTGGRYNPATDSWTPTSTTNAPSGREVAKAVWTGSQMIVWGGSANGFLNTGGRYNPSTDTWAATSITNAPAARNGHTAVWTGSEMIIWGGQNGSGFLNTGGRYNPGADSWTTITTTNAPAARDGHTAVWTGSQMIVWGGLDDRFNRLDTGGRYSPGADNWTATSTTNAPVVRDSHTAIWTGSQMIVWGGDGNTSFLNTGGRYNPSTDAWTPTSTTNAPAVRDAHTAIWTGSQMIVWGGLDNNNNPLNTGGRYCAQQAASPTPAPTPTPNSTPTPAPTPTPTPAPNSTPTPGPTSTPTPTPNSTPTPAPTPTPTPAPGGAIVQFSSPYYTVNEGCVTATITVSRSGDTSSNVTVDYSTNDGAALQRNDYTTATGTITFAPGVTGQTFPVLITKNAYIEGPQTVDLALSNPTGGATLGAPNAATLAINDDTNIAASAQPIDDAATFVCQHYHDFLGREPDSNGLAYWTSQITRCASDQSCIRNERTTVSNAFFYELEFQQTGSYVYRLYRAAYGNNQPFPNPDNSNQTEAANLPSYAIFTQDRGRVVGGAELASGQQALANVFVQRPEFLAKYPASLDGSSFIDAVLENIRNDIGVRLTSQKSNLLALFNSGGRGAVMYRLADDNISTNPIDNRAFIDAEYNRAFVITQYFGYLRRDADIGGFLFWLGQVGNCPLRNVGAQHAMVCSFITSAEYQNRFSLAVTRTNQECSQSGTCSP